MSSRAVKARYLDASAIVKIYADEDGSSRVRELFYSAVSFCSTSLCIMEALGILKGKWLSRNQITEDEYFDKTKKLIISTWGNTIEVDDINLFTPEGQRSTEAVAKKHSLDLSDALQLQTILQGRYSRLSGKSSSILITADEGLAKAARAEGIRVWDCLREDMPQWVL